MSEENQGHVVKVLKDGEWRTYEDVIGHQVGYGSVQVLFGDGGQTIINNYDEVKVVLDAEQQEAFQKGLTQKKMMKQAHQALQTAADDADTKES